MSKIYFVRHGQSHWNVANKICGATDIDLTDMGHEQAYETGRKLEERGIRVDVILCSPLLRAKHTAEHIGEVLGMSVKVDERRIEQNFGKFEGAPRNSVEFQTMKRRFTYDFDGGESMMRVASRIYNLLDEIRERNDGLNYLLVAHNGIARVVNSYFHNMENEEYSAFGIDNCDVLEYNI